MCARQHELRRQPQLRFCSAQAEPSVAAAALAHTVSGSPARCAAQRAAVNR